LTDGKSHPYEMKGKGKKYTAEQIVAKLPEAEILPGKGPIAVPT